MFRGPVCLAVLATVAAAASRHPDVPHTVSADRFVESAGVNVHLHYDNTLYRTNFPLIKSRLLELGVRHVRDGLEDTAWQGYYQRHNELGDAGIKGTFITDPEQSTELWAAYPSRVRSSFEAYEAPNEYDKSGKSDWAPILTDALKRLRGLRDVSGLEQFPVYGPSLTTASAHAAIGNVSAYIDYANLHNYFSGRHPETRGWGDNGYGSVDWNLGQAAQYAGAKASVSTETGYQDASSATDPVPQAIAGRYMPRLLLEHFRLGIVRTFVYELCDFPRSGGYGLLNPDGSPKPSFTAVKGLLNVLADPGAPFAVQNLAYTLVGGTDDVRHMTFQKRDGTYYLALWLAVPSWDPTTRKFIAVEPRSVTVSFTGPMRIVRTHRWQADGSVSVEAASTTSSTVPVRVSDDLTIVETVRPDDGTVFRGRRGGD